MGSLPLHPALVHVPLGLAFVIPLVALALTVLVWRGVVSKKAWAMMVALQAVLVAGGVVAIKTGGAEEERVEDIVHGKGAYHHDEEGQPHSDEESETTDDQPAGGDEAGEAGAGGDGHADESQEDGREESK